MGVRVFPQFLYVFLCLFLVFAGFGCASDIGGSGSDDTLGVQSSSSNGGGGNEGGNSPSAMPSVDLAFGNGFTNEQGPLPPVGSGPGANAKAIARWNVVPFQTIADDFAVGVIAFHINDIDRVEFSLEGGPWISVTDMTYNRRTNTHEYWANVPAKLAPQDARIEVRAIAYPKIGTPRVLPSLFLNTNTGGTLRSIAMYVSGTGNDASGDGSKAAPFRTVHKAADQIQNENGGNADGGIIYMLDGTYSIGPANKDQFGNNLPKLVTNDRWLTMVNAPGTDSANIQITANGVNGMNTKLVHFKGITINSYIGTSGPLTDFLWIDSSFFIGNGPLQDISVLGFLNGQIWDGSYVTNSTVRDNKDALPLMTMVRNVQAYNLGSDAFTQSKLVVNCKVVGIDRKNQISFHPDVYQILSNVDNIIVYGLEAYDIIAQGIFADDASFVSNIAFVNVLIEKTTPVGGLHSQWSVPTDHLLIMGVTNYDQVFNWRSKTTQLTNTLVKNNVFHQMGQETANLTNGVRFENNHYIIPNFAPGSNSTTGDPGFVDAENDDFRPAPGSALRKRVFEFFAPVDAALNGREWNSTGGSIGAYE